jgi:cytochrome oxidase Cu insertion factor (SCO1/SenC/PrrC family)
MMKFNKVIAIASVSAMALVSAVNPSASASTTKVAQPPASVGVATSLAVPKWVLNAKFVNQAGKPETLASLKGKTVFIVPVLTLCSDTCPFTTGNLLQLQARLDASKATNVEIVAIDVDPYRDTVTRLAAYAKLIGANFQLWTEQGATSLPTLTKKELAAKSSVGTGDINANLLAVEKFLGWSVQIVPQGNPPATDWLAPHEKLTYDINHSDGFWIVSAAEQVRFVSGTKPAFTGALSKVLSTFMGYKSNIYKSPTWKGGWTPANALQAIDWAIQTKI